MHSRIFAVYLCVAVLLAGSVVCYADCTESMPTGNWTFSVRPFAGTAIKNHPLVLIETQSDSNLKIGGGAVVNFSTKSITSFRLKWILTTVEDPGLVLREGQSAVLTPSQGPLQANYRLPFSFNNPLACFANEVSTLKVNGSLQGNYVMTVYVNLVNFQDGSSWTPANPGGNAIATNNRLLVGDCAQTVCGAQNGVAACNGINAQLNCAIANGNCKVTACWYQQSTLDYPNESVF